MAAHLIFHSGLIMALLAALAATFWLKSRQSRITLSILALCALCLQGGCSMLVGNVLDSMDGPGNNLAAFALSVGVLVLAWFALLFFFVPEDEAESDTSDDESTDDQDEPPSRRNS